ncbi:MAG: asparagine synthase (glutamine-hydrolyzing) [Gammaproteobacteria bacterium]|nr:asparagine synthase (glutamine-hydrolyzing) [Gammaproteobacteria bacterium]
MCGLTGFLNFKGEAAALAARAGAMTEKLHHRGPDAGAVWCDAEAGIALGHRRLSILDLSPLGAQPMHSKCGRYVIAFNGEIYNFADLRRELEARGAAFAGHSDTEILVEGFAAWGLEQTLARTNGMFAIALWDRTERRLMLARDRLGEKPVYYGWHGGVFLFGSELKALHGWPEFRPEIDRDVVPLYLRHNYVPGPYCIYRGVKQLVPGTFVVVTANGSGHLPEPRPYWSLAAAVQAGKAAPFDGDAAAAVEALDAAMRRSVRLRMVADVPLGAFLSGGIDSSTVVALMQAESTRPVRTFSIGFDEREYDEAPHAKAVAQHLGTDHTELYVTSEEARAVIPRLADMYDEPFADSSQIPTYLVSALARRHVTVAMSGDAGDELFAGYTRYSLALELWQRLAVAPAPLRALAARLLTVLPPRHWDRIFAALGPLVPARYRFRAPGDKLHKLAALALLREPMQMYFRLISLWKEAGSMVPGAHEPATVLCPPELDARFSNHVERMMYLDAVHYLPSDILVKVDRASMAVSLESRVPFLDHDVVGLAWRMPHEYKVRDGVGKWVLRQVLARYVPPALFERPKMGFGIPIDHWLRGALRDWAEHLLDARRLESAGYIDATPVRAAWRAHLAGEGGFQYALWGVLMFEAWRERWRH